MGNWAELTAEDGKLTLSRSGRVAELNDAPGRGDRGSTEPADYASTTTASRPGTHFQDVTVSPDLPSVAQVIGQLYPQMGGEPIDGVIVVDPVRAGRAAQLHRPDPGRRQPRAAHARQRRPTSWCGASTSSSTSRAERADFLDQASRRTFEKLTTGDIPGPEQIGAVLGPAVQDQHLMFSATRPDEQAFLQQLGATGAFPAAQPDRDFFAVTSQNSANNKIDVFLHRTVSYESTYDPGTGRITSQATVTLHNDAPSSGLPDAVIGSNDRGLPARHQPPAACRSTARSTWSIRRSTAPTRASSPSWSSATTCTRRYIGIPPGGTVTVQLDLAGTHRRRS